MTIASIARRAVLLLFVGTVAASAAPAQVRTQVPGYFRYAVGTFEVTALYDGSIDMKTTGLHGIDQKDLEPLLAASFEDGSMGIPTSINAFLVNTGDHLVLVDAGLAGCAKPPLGQVLDNLRASGYRAEDVDAVLITHMHGDHICGLTADGKRVFPNATVYAAKEEAAHWLNDTKDADERLKGGIARAQQIFAPYIAAKAFKTFKEGAVLFPGVTAIANHGHTPGHTSYLFESGGQALLAFGDIVHVGAVQFAHPEVSMDFDTDQKQAIATREALFARLAQTKWAVAGSHLPFPGIGHVRKDGSAYAYVPVLYAPLPARN